MNYFRRAEQRLALLLEFSWNFKHLEFSILPGIRIWLWILHTKECWKCSRKCHGQLFQQQREEEGRMEKLNAVSDHGGGGGYKPDIRRRSCWQKWLLSLDDLHSENGIRVQTFSGSSAAATICQLRALWTSSSQMQRSSGLCLTFTEQLHFSKVSPAREDFRRRRRNSTPDFTDHYNCCHLMNFG